MSDHESTSNCEPIRYPRHKITATTFLVSTEIDEEDKDQPRVIEVKLSDEAPGLLVLQCKIHEDRHIAFFVEQWRALRKAIDTLVAIDETKANLMDQP